MNRRMFHITLLLLLAGSSTLFSVRPTRATVPEPYNPVGVGTTYLALGNSLTTGTEADANNDELPGYPANIYHDLQVKYPNLAYENFGKDGETSTSMINAGQLEQAEAFIANEIANGRRVSPVTLSIGGNDVVSILLDENVHGEQALETFKTNLDTILDRLLTALTDVYDAPQGNLIIMDYYNPYPGLRHPLTNEPLMDEWAEKFNAAIKEAAAERNIPVAEVAQAFSGNEADLLFVNQEIYENPFLLIESSNPTFERDLDYHPRAAGHQVIADQFIAVSGYAPLSIDIRGAETGTVTIPYTFQALDRPESATPITYTWTPTPTHGLETTEATYLWDTIGTKTITVTATSASGTIVTDTHTIDIAEIEPPTSVEIAGPSIGQVDTTYTFTATVVPVDVTLPITYTWLPDATSHMTHTADYAWGESGTKTITVTATNASGTIVTDTHIITIEAPMTAPTSVQIDGASTGDIGTPYTFTATVAPDDATQPLAYVWEPTPDGTGANTASYTWNESGTYDITVVASNEAGTVTATHTITIQQPAIAPMSVEIEGLDTGVVDATYTFTATVLPDVVTTPLTYVWMPQPASTEANTATYQWSATDTYTLTVAASNEAGTATDTHIITIEEQQAQRNVVFLPLVQR